MKLGKGQKNGKLYNDNMSAIHLARYVAFYARTKLRYHFICTLLEGRHISLEKKHTTDNHTNMLTKIVTQEKLKL